MAQSTVSLCLERIRDFGVSLLVVNKRPERTLNLVMEGDHKGVPGHGIGAAIEEKLDEFSVPGEQNVLQRNGLYSRAILDEDLNKVQTLTLDRVRQGSLFLFLPRFVAGEQFDKAVEAGIHGRQ